MSEPQDFDEREGESAEQRERWRHRGMGHAVRQEIGEALREFIDEPGNKDVMSPASLLKNLAEFLDRRLAP